MTAILAVPAAMRLGGREDRDGAETSQIKTAPKEPVTRTAVRDAETPPRDIVRRGVWVCRPALLQDLRPGRQCLWRRLRVQRADMET